MPESPERPAEAESEVAFASFEDPRERLPEVVVLDLQPLHPHALLRSGELWLGFFGQGEEELGVTAVHLVGSPALLKLLPSVLTDGLEHSVAHRPALARPGHHKRLVH